MKRTSSWRSELDAVGDESRRPGLVLERKMPGVASKGGYAGYLQSKRREISPPGFGPVKKLLEKMG
jgi:hypothetical protein